jgi:glycosyltransferase involved in cell wall biosynthesis
VKVLFAVHQFFPDHRAGVEIVTLGLARALKACGHDPRVFAAKRSIPGSGIEPYETQDYEFEGIPVRRVGRPEEGLSRPYELNFHNEEMASKAREYVRETNPDIIHAMHLQGLSASVLPAFKESGVPLVFTATDFWPVCPVIDLRRHDGALCTGPEVTHCIRCIASRNPSPHARRAAHLVPAPLLRVADLTSRTPLRRLSLSLRQIAAVRERPAYIRQNMELVDRVVAYTGLTRDLLIRNGIGAGKTVVSHYGIDTAGLAQAAGRRRPSPTLRVGFVGTLAPHKGCDTLMQAFKMLPPELDVALSIYGDPDRYPSFVEELRKLAAGDPRISFPGAFHQNDLPDVMLELDVLVVPSRWYENAPGVIFEAFAARIPVVATNLKGMSEFVRHAQNGLLFELEDPRDLSRQLRRLREEPGLLESLRAGITPVKTIAEYASEMEELYASLSLQT